MAWKSLTGFDSSSQRVINVADPSSASDAATKSYVDNLIAGLRWKAPVRVATTTNGTLATAYENGDTIDGITLATGDRILLKDQTTQTENGIYTVNASGAPTRATDADSTAELNGAAVLVTSGTVNADRSYIQITDNPTVGSSNIVWNQFGAGQSYTADGNGIELSGTTFSLELNGATLSKGASGLKINDSYAGAGLTLSSDVITVNTGTSSSSLLEKSSGVVRIAADAAGNGLTGGAGSALAVGAGTGISVAADAVAVDTSVVVRKFAQDIGNGSSTSIAVTHNLGTKDITWAIRTLADDSFVVADVVATSTTQATFTFATAPTTNQYRVIIHA